MSGRGSGSDPSATKEEQCRMSITWRLFPALIAFAIISAPLSVEAEQSGRPARIGVLCDIPCQGLAVDAFRRALRELGYVEGRTVVFEYRDAQWNSERLPALAADLVQSKVDVIFTSWGTLPALAAKRATDTIPVVIWSCRRSRPGWHRREPGEAGC
jgi:putative tryptophan/tyrosine transport system substrate-binding protein